MANYRPISVLAVISKVFEKQIDEQLKLFMQDHNILNNAQHGFRKKKSTETVLLQLTKSQFECQAAKLFTYAVALDFSRAFDTIDFKITCNFLSYFTSESAVAWFHSYLTSRQQSTKYCGITSDACSLLSGVPQSDILSATLFTIYLNNLLNLLDQGTAIAYADDNTVIGSGRTPSEAYNNIIQIITTIFNWADRHCLELTLINVNQCSCLLLHENNLSQTLNFSYQMRQNLF